MARANRIEESGIDGAASARAGDLSGALVDLERLENLRLKSLITEAEFRQLKAMILRETLPLGSIENGDAPPKQRPSASRMDSEGSSAHSDSTSSNDA
jgi:hypothetical protein